MISGNMAKRERRKKKGKKVLAVPGNIKIPVQYSIFACLREVIDGFSGWLFRVAVVIVVVVVVVHGGQRLLVAYSTRTALGGARYSIDEWLDGRADG